MKFLPKQPSLEFLNREARALKLQHRTKDESVCKTIGHFDTSFHGLKNDEIFARKFSILDAQRVTARQYGFASWRRLKLFVQKSTSQTNDYNPELRDMLLRRKVMLDALAKRAKKKKPDGRERYREFIDESQAIIKEIYKKYGWPGPQIVGRDGAEACYWLGLSSSKNSKFLRESAMLLENSLPKGECSGIDYAITIDRWLMLSYKPTLFGSVVDFNQDSGIVEYTSDVVDPDNLNKRRSEVGLQIFEEANRELRERLTKEKRPNYKQADWEKMKRQWALKGGYVSRYVIGDEMAG